MKGSKPYGPSGDQQPFGEAPTRFSLLGSPFPSPRPSPSGRGRPFRSLVATHSAVFAGRAFEHAATPSDCSLSLWERGRVRGIGWPSDTRTRTILEIVERRESFGRAGGFPR
jgi:hypothetical protein